MISIHELESNAVDAVLQRLLAEVQAALGVQFVGMIVHGSLAGDGFEPGSSDVDVLVVTGLPPDSLEERHAELPIISILESDEEVGDRLDAASLASAVVASEGGSGLSLVVADLIERLGRSHVFVIPRRMERGIERLLDEAWTPQPFTEDATLEGIDRLVAAGARVVTLAPHELPDDAVPLAAVRSDGSVDLRPGISRRTAEGPLVALVGGAGSDGDRPADSQDRATAAAEHDPSAESGP